MIINDLSLVVWFGTIAAILQVVGYLYYLKYIKSGHIDPNPVTWFMLAYGTALLTLLEWDAEASWAILALPTACTLCTLYIAALCWHNAQKIDNTRWWPKDWWPENKYDKISFITDAIITVGYFSCWYLAFSGILSEEWKMIFVLSFLWLANLSTVPAMLPLLRETRIHPEKEHATPWIIWTLAYIFLSLATLLETNESLAVLLALLAYPVINVVLHALVAWWSYKKIDTVASN